MTKRGLTWLICHFVRRPDNELDKAVDSAYSYKGAKEDAARVAFLFEKYQELTVPVIEVKKTKKKGQPK